MVPMEGVCDAIKYRKPQHNVTHHLEKDLGVRQIWSRSGPLLPPLKEWPRVFVMTRRAVWVDHLVPMEGVDDVIKSQKPQYNLTHHLEYVLPMHQIWTRLGPLLPPAKEHRWVFVMTQPAVVVDHLVPMGGVDDVIKSRKPQDNLPHHVGQEPSRGTNWAKIRPIAPPSERAPMGVCDDPTSRCSLPYAG